MVRIWGVAIQDHKVNRVQVNWRRRAVLWNCLVELVLDGGSRVGLQLLWHVVCFPSGRIAQKRLVAGEGWAVLGSQQDRVSYDS